MGDVIMKIKKHRIPIRFKKRVESDSLFIDLIFIRIYKIAFRMLFYIGSHQAEGIRIEQIVIIHKSQEIAVRLLFSRIGRP